ncbi:MAG TPA: sodium:proton exchanger, partial [Neisseriales bacterium]|nr:sodium:proton exchanger [Neisseriales bacterium]
MVNFIQLVIGMIFILVAAMVFCNALEHLGEKLGISEGVTGSIFVAVGTALPEAIVPLIALFGSSASAGGAGAGAEIGIGAIMGPPLMLSTLSVALMAFSVWKQRGLDGLIRPEKTGLNRDLKFFTFGYALAILLAFSHNFYANRIIDVVVVMILVLSYFMYVMLTIRASSALVKDGHATEAEDELYIKHYLKLPNNLITVAFQAIAGFVGLVYFAHVFIMGITGTSAALGIPAFLLSVVLIPIATELPEKVNSILWIRRGKDTLAFGNITGALVFQGTLLPAIGIMLTP